VYGLLPEIKAGTKSKSKFLDEVITGIVDGFEELKKQSEPIPDREIAQLQQRIQGSLS
jgi:hypothetical protein